MSTGILGYCNKIVLVANLFIKGLTHYLPGLIINPTYENM